MNNSPIGIFDSGLGGLTVLKQIEKLLPNEDLIYLGDNARVPYGNRSKQIINKFSFEDANFLIKQKVKCIVIACNTASAFAGDELKKKLKLPVFDVITPTVFEASKKSDHGRIGVIGTRGTIGSNVYQKKLHILNDKLQIFTRECPLFVPFVEEGEIKSASLKIIVKNYLSELIKAKIDTLILGCTHYPIIAPMIKKEFEKNINIIDPGVVVANDLKKYLITNKMLSGKKQIGYRKYYVTDYTERFVNIAQMFLGHNIEQRLKKIEL